MRKQKHDELYGLAGAKLKDTLHEFGLVDTDSEAESEEEEEVPTPAAKAGGAGTSAQGAQAGGGGGAAARMLRQAGGGDDGGDDGGGDAATPPEPASTCQAVQADWESPPRVPFRISLSRQGSRAGGGAAAEPARWSAPPPAG